MYLSADDLFKLTKKEVKAIKNKVIMAFTQLRRLLLFAREHDSDLATIIQVDPRETEDYTRHINCLETLILETINKEKT